MHVPLAREEDELTLSEIGIDKRMRDAMKSQVPSRKPGVFPFVGHREHITYIDMRPFVVPPRFPLWRGSGLSRITFKPLGHVVVVTLLIPHHAGPGLALN